MKLLHQSSRYYFLFSLIVFAVIALTLFYALRLTLNHATDETLANTRTPLAKELANRDSLTPRMEIMDEIVELHPIAEVTNQQAFRDTFMEIYDVEESAWEYVPYRKYTYDAKIHAQAYRISISLSTVENDDLIRTLLLVVVGSLLLFLVAINLLNRYLSERLWKPFYRTVTELKGFSARQATTPNFMASKTDEFNDLNVVLERMTGELRREYDSLRRFTENASHEIRTPLAIVRNHVDLLLRGPDRSEEDYENLQRISEAVSRLGKLNHTLLLLTKIEHDQFPDAVQLDLATLLREKLRQLGPALEDKAIRLTTELQPLWVHLSPTLADVLLNNLLGNAIRHNLEGGTLAVSLSGNRLLIENTGPSNGLTDRAVFERFRKESRLGDSLGLGLALVQEICDRYGYRIRYEQAGQLHRMVVEF